MSKKQTIAIQPLTGELIQSNHGPKGPAKPTTISAWASDAYAMELGLFKTRIEFWVSFLKTGYKQDGDFSRLADEVKARALRTLFEKFGGKDKQGKPLTLTTGKKQYPDGLAEAFRASWEPIISTMHRVQRTIDANGLEGTLSLIQGKGYGEAVKSLTKREVTKRKPRIPTPPAAPVKAETSGAQPDGAKVAAGAEPSAHTPASLAQAAKVQGFQSLVAAIKAIEEPSILGLLDAVVSRLKNTSSEHYLSLAAVIVDCLEDVKADVLAKYKAADKAKESASEKEPETKAESAAPETVAPKKGQRQKKVA